MKKGKNHHHGADIRNMPFGSSSTIFTTLRVPHRVFSKTPPPKNNYLSIFGHLQNPTPHFKNYFCSHIFLLFELYTLGLTQHKIASLY